MVELIYKPSKATKTNQKLSDYAVTICYRINFPAFPAPRTGTLSSTL